MQDRPTMPVANLTPAPDAQEQPDIWRRLCVLDEAIVLLGGRLVGLEGKLEPIVVRPDAGVAEGEETRKDVVRCGLSDRISSAAGLISGLDSRVIDLLRDLQI